MINLQNKLDKLHQKQYDPDLTIKEKAEAKKEEEQLWTSLDVFPIVIILAMVLFCVGIVLSTS